MNQSPFSLPSERGDRKWQRVLAAGLLLAVLIHLAILLSFRTVRTLSSPFAAAGPQVGDMRAAEGGGGGMEAVQIRVQQPRAETEEAVPEPVPDVEVEVVLEPQPQPDPVPIPDLAASLPGQGNVGQGPAIGEREGPGTADGAGQGAGGSAAEGLSGMVAPVPRGMILPPADRPRNVRGQEVTVWVFVTDRGRVVADSTRLDPPTADAGYNRRLKRSAAEWYFEPARRAGRAVAAWYPYQITL